MYDCLTYSIKFIKDHNSCARLILTCKTLYVYYLNNKLKIEKATPHPVWDILDTLDKIKYDEDIDYWVDEKGNEINPYSYKYLCARKDIRFEYIERMSVYFTQKLSQHVSFSIIYENPNYKWNLTTILNRSDIDYEDFIISNLSNCWIPKKFTIMPSWEIVTKYINYSWRWDILLNNKIPPVDFIINNIEFIMNSRYQNHTEINWNDIIVLYNIPYSSQLNCIPSKDWFALTIKTELNIILTNPTLPWYWDHILFKYNMKWDEIINLDINWHTCTNSVPYDVLMKYEYMWNWSIVDPTHLTAEFLINNPHININWDVVIYKLPIDFVLAFSHKFDLNRILNKLSLDYVLSHLEVNWDWKYVCFIWDVPYHIVEDYPNIPWPNKLLILD